MKISSVTLAILFFLFSTEGYFNIRIEDHSPTWPRINGSGSGPVFPESPAGQINPDGVTDNPELNGAFFDEVAGSIPGGASGIAGSAPTNGKLV